MTEAEFFQTRDILHRYFESRSTSEGVSINPNLRDERSVLLFERLYEEDIADRSFHICAGQDQVENLDAFSKKTGRNLEITLVVIFTALDERYFPLLWNAYVEWMHKGTDKDVVTEMIMRHSSWRTNKA